MVGIGKKTTSRKTVRMTRVYFRHIWKLSKRKLIFKKENTAVAMAQKNTTLGYIRVGTIIQKQMLYMLSCPFGFFVCLF